MYRILISLAIILFVASSLYARSMQYESQAKHEKRQYDYTKQEQKASWQESQYSGQKLSHSSDNVYSEEMKSSSHRLDDINILQDEAVARAAEMSGGSEE